MGTASDPWDHLQKVLFTLYSREEAREALGMNGEGGGFRLRSLLEKQYPRVRINWKRIERGIRTHLDALPESYAYKETRLQGQFCDSLRGFARQLLLADPQWLLPSSELIEECRHELEFLDELIRWRLKIGKREPSRWNQDNRFYWRFALQGSGAPPEAEEFAVGFYDRGELGKAEAAFKILVDRFDGYADGYNYLGLIALEDEKIDRAIDLFRKAVESGRRLFRRRIGRRRFWKDHDTRPYMRGLMNLARSLNLAGRHGEALEVCSRLEEECGDRISASIHRARILLNTGRWREAADAALKVCRLFPEDSLLAAFALFELGEEREALAWFLHGALNHPRAARMLLGKAAPAPRTSEEADDHNTGVDLCREIGEYLKKRSPGSKKFFNRILISKPVDALLDEVVHVVRRRGKQRHSGYREAFDRMTEMKKPGYARERAQELAPEIFPGGLPAEERRGEPS